MKSFFRFKLIFESNLLKKKIKDKFFLLIQEKSKILNDRTKTDTGI